MKKFFKLLAAIFLIGTFVLVISAIFRQETYPSDMKKTLSNEVLSSYCEKEGAAPDAYTHDSIDDFDYKGVIQAKHLTYIPQAGQVQISVRYGTLLFDKLCEDLELAEPPTLENADVIIKLRALKVADGAFSNDDKNLDEDEILSEITIEKSMSLDKKSGRHQYSRLVFDGIDFDQYNCLYLDLYYGEETEPYTNIIIYHEDAAKYGKQIKLTVQECQE